MGQQDSEGDESSDATDWVASGWEQTGGGSSDPGSAVGSDTSETGDDGPRCGDGKLDADEICDDGNEIDADGCNDDCTPSGELVWDFTFGGEPDRHERAFGVAAEPDGTFVVAGYERQGSSPPSQGWLRRFTATGDELWTMAGASVLGAGEMAGVVSDLSGVLYVVGDEEGPSGESYNGWLRKQELDGTDLWTRTYDGPSGGWDRFEAVAFDGVGNIVVAGRQYVASAGQNMIVRKYAPDGDLLWSSGYGGPDGSPDDRADDVAVSPAGSVYVAGYDSSDGGAKTTGLVVKFNGGGDFQWAESYDIPSGFAHFYGVTTVGDDDAVVAGSGQPDLGIHVIVRRYDRDGGVVWSDTHVGVNAEGAYGRGIGKDSAGQLVVVGGEYVDGPSAALVRKYDEDGAVMWSRTYAYPDSDSYWGNDVAFGPERQVYIAGAISPSDAGGWDLWAAIVTR